MRHGCAYCTANFGKLFNIDHPICQCAWRSCRGWCGAIGGINRKAPPGNGRGLIGYLAMGFSLGVRRRCIVNAIPSIQFPGANRVARVTLPPADAAPPHRLPPEPAFGKRQQPSFATLDSRGRAVSLLAPHAASPSPDSPVLLLSLFGSISWTPQCSAARRHVQQNAYIPGDIERGVIIHKFSQ